MPQHNYPPEVEQLLNELAAGPRLSQTTRPPEVEELLDQMAQQAGQAQQVQQTAQGLLETSPGGALGRPFNAAGRQISGNLSNRVGGLTNSALMALNAMGIKFPPESAVGSNPFTAGFAAATMNPDQALSNNREMQLANQELMDALQDEAPVSSFVGDATTFVAEMLAGGKGFKHANPKVQLAGRMAQEGGVGAMFGASTVGMSDTQKEALIAGGLLTGMITPAVLRSGGYIGGKLIHFDSDTINRIATLARMEKLFQKTGLMTMGELLGSRGLLKIEAAMDNIPWLGLGKKRDEQFHAFQEMVGTIFDRVGKGRVGQFGLTDEARRSLEVGLFNRYHRNYDVVSNMFDKVGDEINQAIPGVIPKVVPRNMRDAAKELLTLEMRLPKGSRSTEMVNTLKGYLDSNKPLSFDDARRLLSRIKEQAANQKKKAVTGDATKDFSVALTKMEVGLMEDMKLFADFIQQNGGGRLKAQNVVQQLDQANDAFKRLVLPFYKASTVSELVHGMDYNPDAIIGAFISETAPRGTSRVTSRAVPFGRDSSRRATEVVNTPSLNPAMVNPQEQDIVRGLILREAFDRGQQGNQFVDPLAFSQELGKMQKLWKVNFTREQQEIIEGYLTLAKAGHRAFTAPSAIGSLVLGGTAAMVGANKAPGGAVKGWLASLLFARFALGTKAGTDLVKMAAGVGEDFSTKEGRQVLKTAEVLFTRFVTNNYPDIYKSMNPEDFEKFSSGNMGPYKDFNPATDPYLQMNRR